MRGWLAVLVFAAGCGGGGFAEVSGTVGSKSFSDVQTVLHGGPFILLLDQKVDCLDVAWVDFGYFEGQQPVENFNFVGVQFAFDGDLQPGTNSVYGDSSVASTGMYSHDDTFEVYPARDGTVTLDEVVDDKTVRGSFDVSFDEGGVSGTFETEYCRNLRP